MINTEKKIKLYPIKLMISVLIILLLGASSISSNEFLNLIIFGLISFYIILGNDIDDFYLYIFLLPFSDFILIDDKSVLFIFLFISILKLLYNNLKKLISFTMIVCLTGLLFLEILNDFMNISLGRFLYIIIILLYYTLFISYSNFSKIDRSKVVRSLLITILIVMTYIIIDNGGNLLTIMNSDTNNRFGEETRQLGGAMGVPIYIMMFITSTYVIIMKEKEKKITKTFLLITSIFLVFLGFLTLSRVYLLGLLTFIFMILLYFMFNLNNNKQIIKIIILFSVIIVLFGVSIGNIESLINTTINRSGTDISTGRFDIYNSIFDFFKSNPLNIFTGKGAVYYSIFGEKNGYQFSMTAHNLYLDSLMSWGLIGTLCFSIITLYLIIRMKNEYNFKIDLISFTPLAVWLVMVMVGDAFYYFKTYISLLVLIIIACVYGVYKLKRNNK